MQGPDFGVHDEEAVVEVGVGAGEAGKFTPPHAGVRGGGHQ